MLNIEEKRDQESLIIKLEGRLDTTTAPELERVMKHSLDGVTDLVMDLEKLNYISSAGLRILLVAQKTMNRQGTMKLIHVCDGIMEILESTGFVTVLTIE